MSKKYIESLTKQQEDMLSVYRDNWIQHGLSTEPVNKQECEEWARKAYEKAGLTIPDTILWAKSPMDAIKIITEYSKDTTAWDVFNSFLYGQHEAGWLSFYDFFMVECGVKDVKPLVPLIELGKRCGWWSAFENLIVLQERPIAVHFNSAGSLHKDMGMAIEYNDGFGVYALDGIRVKREYAMTPANEIDCRLVLKEKSVDVRRVLINKIGIERLLSELDAKVIDKDDTYELVILDLDDDRQRPFLKMRNPSIDAIHVEGVPPDIRTIVDALAWRNGFNLGGWIPPEVLT